MPDGSADKREQISNSEAIAYIEGLLPEIVALAASEPDLQYLLKMAHLEARSVVRNLSMTTLGKLDRAPYDDRR